MMKRMCVFVCAMFLFLLAAAAAASAGAEVIVAKPTYYNIKNDVPAWKLNLRNLTDETIQELRGGTFSANLLPINEDTLLWYGTFEYHYIAREEWHEIEYPDGELPRQDAYAVAVDMEGNRKWSLGLSDPHSQNGFTNARLLPDGRILLLHYNPFGEWGSQYYIVSSDGEVQEMLPSYKIEDDGVRETLKPMHGGYFGGGVQVESGGQGTMYEEANFAFYDKTLDLIWQNQSDEYAPAGFLGMCEVSDGFLIAGTYYSGYDPNVSTMNQMLLPTPIVSKIGLDGETKWIYKGNELSATGVSTIVPTADGGALFSTMFDPTTATTYEEQEASTLTKLNSDGVVEWMKRYDEGYAFRSFGELVPYKEGYLAPALLATEETTWAVLYIAEDGTPITRIDVELEDAQYSYVGLVAAPNGNVYAYGSTTTSQTVLAGMDQMTDCKLFYLDIDKLLLN